MRLARPERGARRDRLDSTVARARPAAYFSRPGENYHDGGRRTLQVGNTQVVAEMIQPSTGCDVYRITAADPYSDNYDTTVQRNVREQNSNARPAIVDPPACLDGYDTVVLGSPVWNVRPPMIMSTFSEAYDFTGTTVLPLVTDAVSGLGRTVEVYTASCRGATFGEALAVRGEEVADSRATVDAWLRRVGLTVDSTAPSRTTSPDRRLSDPPLTAKGNTMKQRTLGTSLTVSEIGFGCMSLTGAYGQSDGPLTELRAAHGAGLEEMFLELTADVRATHQTQANGCTGPAGRYDVHGERRLRGRPVASAATGDARRPRAGESAHEATGRWRNGGGPMSDVELKRKESLTRHEAAERLTALANALTQGGRVHIDLGGSTVALDVPDHVHGEIEVEVDGDEVELELEFKWSTASARSSTDAAVVNKATPAAGHSRAHKRG